MSPRAMTNAEARNIAARMTRRMLAVLIEHGDRPQPILAGSSHSTTIHALRDRNLLKVHATALRPKETMATTRGRQVIAAALAIEADKLTIIQGYRDDTLSREATTPTAPSPRQSEPVR